MAFKLERTGLQPYEIFRVLYPWASGKGAEVSFQLPLK